MDHYTLDMLVKDRKRELIEKEEQRREREQRLSPTESRWRVIREENGGLTVVFRPRSF